MNEILRTILKVFFALAVLFVLLNDPGRYYQVRLSAQDRAKEAAQTARQVYENTQNIIAAKDAAAANVQADGGKLISLELVNDRFVITVSYPVKNTLFIERIEFLKPYSEVQVKHEEEKGF